MGFAKILTFVTGLVAAIWSTGIQSASLNAEARPKSSLVLNESFIRLKILERYQPVRSAKNPRILLTLPEDSGIPGNATASTLPSVPPSPLKISESTKTIYNEFSFSTEPHSKMNFYEEKHIFESGNNRYHEPSSTESSMQASAEESESQEEDYSASELSEEELKVQQSEYNSNSWLSNGRKEALNSLLNNNNYYSKSQPLSTDEQQNTSDSSEEQLTLTTTSPSAPKQIPALVSRRIDIETPQVNGLYIQGFSHLFQGSREVEKGVANDDQRGRYFIKAIPKDTISASVSPIVDYTTSFTSANIPAVKTHPSEILNNFTQITLSGDTTSSSKAVESLLMLQPSTALVSSQAFAAVTQRSEEEITEHASDSSTITAVSNNMLPAIDAKLNLLVSPYVSSLKKPGETTIPTPNTSTASTDTTSIPGVPGVDYPILAEIPFTGFNCQNQRYKGFFADVATKCQAWHYCDFTDGHSTFLCPNGTLFSQVLLTCDWWFKVDCSQAQQLYVLNERLYRYIKPPKLSFPEDFHGPQVDLWLAQQLQLGLLPKMKKKVTDKVVINN